MESGCAWIPECVLRQNWQSYIHSHKTQATITYRQEWISIIIVIGRGRQIACSKEQRTNHKYHNCIWLVFACFTFSPPHVTESKQFFYWLDPRGLGMGLRTLCSIQYLVKIVQLTGIGKAPRTRFNDCRNLKNIYRGGQKSLFYRLGDSSASREVRSRNLHRDKRVLPSLCKCAERWDASWGCCGVSFNNTRVQCEGRNE